MLMLLNTASPDNWVMSISRSVALPGLSLPARMTRLIEVPGTTTDWHRLDRSALLMPDTATGCAFPALSSARPPYWTNPLPTSWSAETLKVEPETANDAAIAPLAMPNTMAPATARAGTETAANRRHRVRPSTREPGASFTDPPCGTDEAQGHRGSARWCSVRRHPDKTRGYWRVTGQSSGRYGS